MNSNTHEPLPVRTGDGVAHLSVRGSLRDENQDARVVGEQMWLVADGMGGHTGGQIASRTAAVAADRAARNSPTALPFEIIGLAHEAVLETAQQRGMLDMGTTMVVAARDPRDGALWVAWAGGSRAYQVTPTVLRRLTDDHNGAELERVSRDLDYDDVWDHPGQHNLTSFVGGGMTRFLTSVSDSRRRRVACCSAVTG